MNKPNSTLDLSTSVHSRGEFFARWLAFACALLTVLITGGIVIVLVVNAADFFADWSIWSFLTGSNWSPAIAPLQYGVLPLVCGTLLIMFGAAVIALPLGLASAVYLSEYAAPGVRAVVKPCLEVLAGIPTVVYGFFALVYITPALRHIFPSIGTFNALSASIVVGIMIIPLVASISEDALRAVPKSLRLAGFGLGANKFSVVIRIVIPSAFSGIIASFILALSRAIGETMAVTIVAGQSPYMIEILKLDETFLKPVETMTAAMVNIGMSDVTGDSLAYRSLFAIGLLLFVITFVMNILGSWVTSRFQEKYE